MNIKNYKNAQSVLNEIEFILSFSEQDNDLVQIVSSGMTGEIKKLKTVQKRKGYVYDKDGKEYFCSEDEVKPLPYKGGSLLYRKCKDDIYRPIMEPTRYVNEYFVIIYNVSDTVEKVKKIPVSSKSEAINVIWH